MSDYASYEKEIECIFTRIRHIVRIKPNSRAIDVKDTLKNVPNDAIVNLIVGDDDNDGIGEIYFDEEKSS